MSISSVALLAVGIVLVALGLFAAGNIVIVGMGLVAMIAAGVLEVLAARRR